MKILKYFSYIILQCTWGIAQTLIGFSLYIKFINCKHEFYKGCIKTSVNHDMNVSLGLFIFVGAQHESETMTIHEYGHTIQSLILGPLYLIVIGLPSFIWCALPYFQKMRETKQISYYSFWAEKWADKLGAKFT